MVRHSKRHSRKKGGKSGKRSRSRRQYGGMWRITEGWKSLITSDDNVVHDTTTSTFPQTLEKGIDIKYRVLPSGKPEWLIGGKEHTVRQLLDGAKKLDGAKNGRYKDVIEEVRKSRIDLPDGQKGITLTHNQFCRLFMQFRHQGLLPEQKMQRRLAYKYKNVTPAVVRELGSDVCDDRPTEHNIPILTMHKAQRPDPAYRASSAAAGPSAAYPPTGVSQLLAESYVSGNVHNHKMQNM